MKPYLHHWDSVQDLMCKSEKHPSVTLSLDDDCLCCTVRPDGTQQYSTRYGGGHGEAVVNDGGRDYKDWLNLVKEAEDVRTQYWGAET